MKIVRYRLSEPYILRGWERQPMVLINREDHGFFHLSSIQFTTLMLCDGVTEIQDLLTPDMQEVLTGFAQRGMIQKVEEQQPISENQRYKYYSNRYVESVYWSITGRCNCRCRHCYVDAPTGRYGELSTEEALNIIDQMADCGIMQVEMSGGEPFVRKDLWLLIDRMIERGISVGQVYTNACLVDEHTLDEFEKRSLYPRFVVSFDGLGWHDWLRGLENVEEETLRGIRLLVKRGFSVTANMCVHRGNISDLNTNIQYLESMGVRHVNVSGITDTPLWRENNQGNLLETNDYYAAMLSYIFEYYRSNVGISVTLGGVIELFNKAIDGKRYSIIKHNEPDDYCEDCLLCGVIRWICYITPEGRLVPCMPMTWHEEQKNFPLIKDIGLRRGLNDSYFMEFVSRKVSDLIAHSEECRDCRYLKFCKGGCRANALDFGDLMGPDKDSCFYWQNGYHERIRKVAEEAVAKYCPEA